MAFEVLVLGDEDLDEWVAERRAPQATSSASSTARRARRTRPASTIRSAPALDLPGYYGRNWDARRRAARTTSTTAATSALLLVDAPVGARGRAAGALADPGRRARRRGLGRGRSRRPQWPLGDSACGSCCTPVTPTTPTSSGAGSRPSAPSSTDEQRTPALHHLEATSRFRVRVTTSERSGRERQSVMPTQSRAKAYHMARSRQAL